MSTESSSTPPPLLPPEPPPPPPKKHGCFFYGCITALVLLLVVALSLFFGIRYGLNRLNDMVAQYSDTKPMALPVVELPADEMKALKERVDAFSDALNAHTNTAPLTLTGPQINALLASEAELAPYKGKFLVSLEGGQTKAQISLALDDLPKIPRVDTKGRYLNGSGTFEVAITNGVLSLSLASLEAKGKPAPTAFLAAFIQNMVQSVNTGPNADNFKQIESLQVTNGTLVLTQKKN
jgi:HAMP domain-containing protein